MSQFVPLSRGLVAQVDDKDLPLVEGLKWHALRSGGHAGYYAGSHGPDGYVYMHRVILGPGGPHVDHINGDGLDNRRSNLRHATPSQNGANSGPRRGTSRFKGVGFDRARGKWKAAIKINRVHNNLGRFDNEEDAARAYDAAAVVAWGEYAYLNFPEGSK
jgi:hypothetical protein